jgi:hypothetical protein
MLTILPLLSFILVFNYFFFEQSKTACGWRKAFLTASIVSGVYLVFLTETLSLLKAITPTFLAAAWAIPILLLVPFILQKGWYGQILLSELVKIRLSISSFLIFLILFVVSLLAMISFFAPPNTVDSLVYHMARVVFWMDHNSVAYFPTNTLRQLYQPPLAEYIILHLQVLSGTDRFANLVQWFSMVGSLVGVSLIAKQLGASRNGQLLASVIAVTIPMGILQSTSTQNDYVVSFYLICFVYFLLESRENICVRSVLFAGAGLGLAILSKVTAYIYAAPFLLVWCLFIVLKFKIKSWKPFLLVAAMVIALNLGQFARNLDLFGNPIGPLSASGVGEVEYANELRTLPALISNLTRNIALHLRTSNNDINQLVDNVVHSIHNAIQLDVSDPRLTYGSNPFALKIISFNEDYDGNLLHIILIGITMVASLSSLRLRRMKGLLIYSLVLIAGFILFCFYLRWQPWNSRLHLSWFLLWSPVISIAFTVLFRQRWLAVLVFGCTLFTLTSPWMIENKYKPLMGLNSVLTRNRMDQYFVSLPDYQKDYAPAVKEAGQNSCSKIGLYLPGGWEYPAWVYLKNADSLRIKDVQVTNISHKYVLAADFIPCAIISNNSFTGEEVTIDQQTYQKIWESATLSVWGIH